MGPLGGHGVHLSFGTGTAFLILEDEVGGQLQGAVVPLPVSFRSGSHRGRFHTADGHLYISGMNGWGSYTPEPGCLERIRFVKPAGDARVQMPIGFHVHDNGVVVRFAEPVDPAVAAAPARQRPSNRRCGSGAERTDRRTGPASQRISRPFLPLMRS